MSANATAPGPSIDVGRAWPGVRAEVLRVLAGRQVPRADAEDIVQEVAVRALQHRDGFATSADLARWSWRVAWRLRIDAVRKERRITADPFPDVVSTDDTAQLVEGRMALEAVLSGLTRLSAADRAALVEAPAPAASRKDAVRMAVQRHRARARLARLLGGLPVAWPWLAPLRRLRMLRPRARIAMAAAPVAMLVGAQLGTLVLGGPHSGPTPPRPLISPSVVLTEARAAPVTTAAPPAAPPLARLAPAPRPAPTTVAVVPIGDSLRVRVTTEDRPDPPTLCLQNIGGTDQVCVDRPGPAVSLPVPAG